MTNKTLFIEHKKGHGAFRNLYDFILKKKIILTGYRGSIAHNLHIPRQADDLFGIDDIDFMELYCFPIEFYLSLEGYNHNHEATDEIQGDIDSVCYEIRKAFYLLSGCNPNVMLLLYNKPEHYQFISESGKLLLKHRDIFISKNRIIEAFAGYATDQLRKLSKGTFKGYMGEKRKRIVQKFGYDTKNAVTLFRLLRQAQEFLRSGLLKVYRDEDRDELLAIKQGKYSLEEIQNLAEKEFIKVQTAYEQSKLPEKNNKTNINELLVDIITMENS